MSKARIADAGLGDAQRAKLRKLRNHRQRIVGEHPGNLFVIGAGIVLLVAIVLAGLYVRRRGSGAADRR